MNDAPAALLAFAAVGLGVVLILVVAFSVMSRLFARASGWNALAELYAASFTPDAPLQQRRHTQVGAVRYRNCSTIGVSASGLFLSVSAPVISKHPPLLIPWSAITAAREVRLYWVIAVQLAVGRPPITTVVVPRDVYETMRPYLRWLDAAP
jgi:hypothetical protein